MDNLKLYNEVRAVPDNAKKKIQGGRIKNMTDINPMWRIKVLTEQFGPCGIGWYYKPVKKWIERHGDEAAAFVDIELYVKVEGEWSMPIPGNGGSSFSTVERSGVYVSDECYKMATTDALSVACKQLGIGADVYFQADVTKYTPQQPETQQRPQQPQQPPKQASQQPKAATKPPVAGSPPITTLGGNSNDAVEVKEKELEDICNANNINFSKLYKMYGLNESATVEKLEVVIGLVKKRLGINEGEDEQKAEGEQKVEDK